MNKILVAVDFSANSRKTIRFAIQMASQSKAEIIFFHLVGLLAPTSDATWDYTYYIQFQEEELQRSKNHLVKLIKEVYNSKLPSGVKYTCVCQSGNDIADQIISYAQKHKIDFICTGARGTGVMAKLFGTVAQHLITDSPIPVFVIPKNYRLKPLTDLCYASDMENPEVEIKKVLALATSLRASVKVLHFDYEIGLHENQDKLTAIAQKYETKNIKFHYKKLDAIYPLQDHLKRAIALFKPSLVVLFTKQNRKWFDRLLLSSKSAEFSFTTKVPLLVYRKIRL
ncbi:universal stress protein [Flavobacterium sp. 102]|uniref:universal stress protein n=1 Tax=Flavobacterium sp. 102 TaxID=2135623 RepID=UPI000EB3E7A1|nr:universal stress protein [Flavobacterium sp. 102]RKS03604.1 nucleotide-binding universal stress UspA family protein [Flavobacterium sp. 102]